MESLPPCPPPPVIVVAVCNFTPPFPNLPSTSKVQFLQFFIGERIKIISHCDNWCFGQYEFSPEKIGIFPSNFVEVVDENFLEEDAVQRRASTSVFYSDEEAKILLFEITEVLKNWWKFIKSKFSRGLTDLDFQKYVFQMKELMLIRKKILSGSIPTEELRELRRESAKKIDLGNHLMGLGMHIRDESSKILKIDKLSVVAAYREHEKAYSKITSEDLLHSSQSTAIVLNLFQSDFKLHFDYELTLMLWHSGLKKAISETLTFKWSKNLGKFDHKSLNAMFIGLSEKELMDEKLELTATVSIMAPIDIAVMAASNKYVRIDQLHNALPYKQLLAEAKMSLAEKLRDISDKEKRELRLPLKPVMSIEKYQPFSARRGEFFIEFTLQKLKGRDMDEIRIRHPEIFLTNLPISIRRFIPENLKMMIEEFRNEIYFKLGFADLHGKQNEKNIEAILKVFDDEGNPQNSCFEIITTDGIQKIDSYKSRIFCLEDKPNFGELVKIILPEKSTRDLHLRIIFYNRRTMEKTEKGPFAMSYLRLFNKGVLEKSANDELLVYKIEKFEERNVSYLRQNSTKSDQKNNSKPQLKPESKKFYAPNIFFPLSKAVIDFFDSVPRKTEVTKDPLMPLLKALGYLTKILIKSKEYYEKIKVRETNMDFKNNLMEILSRIKALVQDDMNRMISQNAAIKYLPSMFPPLMESNIFSPLDLAYFVKDLLSKISINIIRREKISFLKEIVATDLFKDPDCINVLLPIFLDEVVHQLDPGSNRLSGSRKSDFLEEDLSTIQLSSEVLSDIVETLFPFSQLKSVYQTGIQDQLQLIISKSLRPVTQTVITLLRKDPSKVRPIQALLLALLHKFSTHIFINFLAEFKFEQDKVDFLTEILHMFRDLLDHCPFPPGWYQMIYLQNKVFMKHIRFIKAYILRYFLKEEIDFRILLEFFRTGSCIIQKIIPNEEKNIYNFEIKSMRESAALILRSMWFSLIPSQKPFIIEKILGDLITVILVDDKEIRAAMIPIFYDMMMVEKNDERRFVDEFIMHLDPLVDKGLGNSLFKNQLKNELTEMCCKDDYVQLEFVERIDRLMELLLNLRQVRNDADCVESGKFCLVQLIDFYESINLNELKVHHLNNLYTAHLESGSNVEAGFTLRRIADLLDWSRSPVPKYISKRQYDRGCSTQASLQENLFIEMTTLFDKGEHWEKAIQVLKELIPVYEHILIDYGKLADLHRRIGVLYDKINTEIRTESYYFFVGFYGKGFPDYLSNKKFVFRGEKLEMLGQFKERMLNKYFGAQSVDSMDNCDSLMNSEGKSLQIIPITPVKSSKSVHNPGETALIKWYFKHHDISEFEQIRSERKDKTKWTKLDLNDSTRLWIRKKIVKIAHKLPGILNFSPVEIETEPEPLNPVEVAIQKIEEVNENLRETAEMVANGFNQYVVSLGGWIRGVLQADVGGGIKNYDSFFTDEIRSEATMQEIKSISKLRRLLLHHVAILESCLCVHASKPNFVNESLHAALVDLFLDYRRNIESRFGPAESLISGSIPMSIHLPASGHLGALASTPSFAHASTSSLSLSLDESGDKQNVLLRAVPGAATLLRNTMSRTKMPQATGKKSSSNLNRPDSEFEQSRDQMLQTLRELACRSIVGSPEPRDTLKDFEAMVNSTEHHMNGFSIIPPLPKRTSEFHGPLITHME